MHLRAAAARTPSGVPPMPKRMSVPAPGQPVAMAPATSPSEMRRMRAPVARTSATRASWRGRSRITAVRSRTGRPRASERACRFSVGRAADVAGALGPWPHGELLHVDAGTGVEHGAPLGHGDDGQGAATALGGQRRAVDGVDRDVGQRGRAVTDLLPVEEHRRVVLLALADDHDAVHRHAGQDGPHGLDRRPVGTELVAPAHPSARRHGGGLGDPDEVHGEVPVGGLARRHHGP